MIWQFQLNGIFHVQNLKLKKKESEAIVKNEHNVCELSANHTNTSSQKLHFTKLYVYQSKANEKKNKITSTVSFLYKTH